MKLRKDVNFYVGWILLYPLRLLVWIVMGIVIVGSVKQWKEICYKEYE